MSYVAKIRKLSPFRYDKDLSLWRANNQQHKGFLATSDAKVDSLLIGPQKWTVYNDSKDCSLTSSYTMVLKLTGCSEEEFTCSDGSCVHMTSRCNGKNDCSDETDEAECKAFVQSIGYDRFKVPTPLGNDTKHNVFLAINVWDIVEINEKDGFVRCTILLTRKWIDQKVTFQNLQNETEHNPINPEDRGLLWKPWTVFNNIEDRSKYAPTDAEPVWRVIPNSNYSFVHAGKEFLHNTYLFDGASNMILYDNGFTIEWLCDFHMEWFPFDTQSCTMEFLQAEDTVRLLPESVEYSGGELPQHFIRNITMCSEMLNGKEGVIVEIIFGRPLSSKFLTVKLSFC